MIQDMVEYPEEMECMVQELGTRRVIMVYSLAKVETTEVTDQDNVVFQMEEEIMETYQVKMDK